MLFIVKYAIYAAVYSAFKVIEWLASFVGLLAVAKSIQCDGKQTGRNITFEGTVQTRWIWWRHKANMAYPASPMDFISWPSGTSDHTSVLQDNVSLYSITGSEAWFVETPRNKDIYSSETDPFLYASQFTWAQRLHVVPMDVLVALGDTVGQPKLPVVLISSHGRCGSTLLSQFFETVPDVVTLAEPDVLVNAVWLRWQNRITTDQLKRIVPALMKILCRPMTSQNVSLYCIKTRSTCAVLVDIIASWVPDVKHIFLYRNCAQAVASMERSFAQGMDVVEFWYKCLKSQVMRSLISKVRTNQLMAIFSVIDMSNHRYISVTDADYMASLTPLGLWTINWAIPCAEYLRFHKAGVNIKGVRYEDMISSTEAVVKGLTAHTGIKLDPKVITEQVLPKDSQRGSTLSQDMLNSFNKLVPNERSKAEMHFICTKLGLPDAEHQTLLEGTIAQNL